MFCDSCGKQINDNSKFCIFCGQSIASMDDFLAGYSADLTPAVPEAIPSEKPVEAIVQKPESGPVEEVEAVEMELPDYVPIKSASRPAPVVSSSFENAMDVPDPTKPSAIDPDSTVALAPANAPAPVPVKSTPAPAVSAPEKPAVPEVSAPASPAQTPASPAQTPASPAGTVAVAPVAARPAAAPARQTPPPIPKSAMAQRTAAARPAAPVSRPAAVPPPVPSGYTPRGAYVQKSDLAQNKPPRASYSSGYSSYSSGDSCVFARVVGALAALCVMLSLLCPFITEEARVSAGRSYSYSSSATENYTWGKIVKEMDYTEFFSPTFIVILSIAGLVLALFNYKGTKIAYFIYSIYAVITSIFCMSKIGSIISDLKDTYNFYGLSSYYSDYIGYDISRSIGFYILMIGAVASIVAGISFLFHLDDGPSGSYSYVPPVSNIPSLNPYLQNYNDYNRNPGANEWQCTCGKINQNFTGTCACGMRKSQVQAARKAAVTVSETNRAKLAEQKENEKIQLLKDYKDLLDSGVITQEEFDAKKNKLLGK